MKIAVVGAGYVGLVTAACLAELGNDVVCVDRDHGRVAMLQAGGVPIFEPGLDDVLQRNRHAGRLHFTTTMANAVSHGEVVFIAVGTPPQEDGSADLQHVLGVAEQIGQHMNAFKVVVNKSTVPVGTGARVEQVLRSALNERGLHALDFAVVSNPEFLKEGAALEDFMRPDRIVIGLPPGEVGDTARRLMARLYAPFNRHHERSLWMDVASAELTKYAANAMLATRISFMNELANLAEALGADIEMVRQGMGSDPRIGYHFLYPGAGYGGSCFPKDVKALIKTASDQGGLDLKVLTAVEAANDAQKHVLGRKVKQRLGDDLKGRHFAVWGLAFKPNTDDMREAPSRTLIEALWQAGARVQAFDPVAMDEMRRIYGNRPDLALASNKYNVLEGADALVICTEWQQFRAPDFDEMESLLRAKVIVDGRNLYNPARLEDDGWRYHSVGRSQH